VRISPLFKGTPRAVPDIEHALETDEKLTPKKQKLRKLYKEKVKAVKAEVQRLQDAKVIREVMYPIWLANTVQVKKKNRK
jgi:hypothetical protein